MWQQYHYNLQYSLVCSIFLRVFDVNTYSKYYIITLQPHTHLSMYLPAGVDYTSIRGTRLVFSETSTRQCVDVSITDDDILEEDEDFTATLVDMPSEGIVIDPDEATIVIVDDTGAYSRTYYVLGVLIDPTYMSCLIHGNVS